MTCRITISPLKNSQQRLTRRLQNIFLTSAGVVKLGDFGVSKARARVSRPFARESVAGETKRNETKRNETK